MSAMKWGIAGWLLVAAVAIGLTARSNGQGRDPSSARSEIRGVVKEVKAGTITVTVGEARDAAPTEKTFSLVKDVEVAVDAAGLGGRGGLYKEGKLADLAAGTRVSLTLTADQKAVDSILAETPTVHGLIKAVDAAKKTITVSQGGGREPAAEEKTYAVTSDAEVYVDDGRGRRFSFKEGKLNDLIAGANVTVRLSLDSKNAQTIMAEGPAYSGTLKAVDAAKKTITLMMRPPRGDDAGEEKTLTMAADAVVLIDDGKGRRLSLKEGKLGDVPVGSAAMVKMSQDQAQVTLLRIEGPMVMGMLKGIDPDKGLVIIAIPKGRDDPEEKTLTLAKDSRVIIDGAESKLANLKVGDNGPIIQARMSLDQKTVQVLMSHQPQPR